MAAEDTFEWYISELIDDADQETLTYINMQREYLLTLRSEDEQQRFVDEVIAELRYRLNLRKKSWPAYQRAAIFFDEKLQIFVCEWRTFLLYFYANNEKYSEGPEGF